MTKFASSLAITAAAATIAAGHATSANADTQPKPRTGMGGVHVELAADLSASQRAAFDRMGGRSAVARAVGAALGERSDLTECGDNLTVTVTDYRFSRAPWSGSGRAARPYRAVSSGQKDKISAVVAVREATVEPETVSVQAHIRIEDTRRSARLDNLVEQLADAVADALARNRDGWC